MVWCLKRWGAYQFAQRCAACGEGADGGYFHGCVIIKWRQDARQPFCEHGLSRPGWPRKEQVVPSSGGDFEGESPLGLPGNVRHI